MITEAMGVNRLGMQGMWLGGCLCGIWVVRLEELDASFFFLLI